MSSDPLRDYRDHIDAIDRKLVDVLEERFDVVEEIKRYKKSKDIDAHDEERAGEVLESRVGYGKLYPAFIRELFELIIKESERKQK